MARFASSLKSRFEGCLVGAVAGDCIGCPFESGTYLPEGVTLMQKVVDFVQNLNNRSKERKLWFTDDTAMARSVAASLIHCNGQYNARDMARRFSEEYAKEPDRGYGGNVVAILPSLGDAAIEDVYAPARTQFDGSGSYGNGGAMRIAPVGLCASSNLERVIEIAGESAKLTHSNRLGYDGAILEACAVHMALHSDPATFDSQTFLDSLLKVMEGVEERSDASGSYMYSSKLRLMKEMLTTNASTRDVGKGLGNDVAAHKSVPASVYSFLRCLRPVQGIPTDNCMERTIMYAISLDGDTDTIASMAGAIAGAFYGLEEVPAAWMDVCEGMDNAVRQADQLFAVTEVQDQKSES